MTEWTPPSGTGAGPAGGGQAPAPTVPAWGDDGELLPGAGLPLADWGQRLAAYLIDSSLAGVVVGALMPPFMVMAMVLVNIAVPLFFVPMLLVFATQFLLQLVIVLMDAAPYGQTPGRHWLRIRVVTADGRLLSRGQALLRSLAKVLSAAPLMLGFLWPLWDPERRTFHDMILGTRVVVAVRPAPSFLDLLRGPFTRGR